MPLRLIVLLLSYRIVCCDTAYDIWLPFDLVSHYPSAKDSTAREARCWKENFIEGQTRIIDRKLRSGLLPLIWINFSSRNNKGW